MSGYRGRTGPNFSKYINDLNELSPESGDPFIDDMNDLDTDLAMFTNTDLQDIDMAKFTGVNNAFNLDLDISPQSNFSDLLATTDFDADFSIPAEPISTRSVPLPQTQQQVFYQTQNQPQVTTQQIPLPQPFHNHTPTQSQYQTLLQPRLSNQPPRTESPDATEQARIVAEEDKRRRNTAASARFRVKKKQREQRLEDDLKLKTSQLAALQEKLNRFEMENRHLRELLLEKAGMSPEQIKDSEVKRDESTAKRISSSS